MALPLRTDDAPQFDTYPGPESPETSQAGSTLHAAAERVGSTVGRAVRAARDLPDRMEQLSVSLRDRMNVVRGGRSGSAGTASELKDAARQKLEEGRLRATELARQARARAVRIADERPLHVLIGILALGAAAGIALRLWRDRD